MKKIPWRFKRSVSWKNKTKLSIQGGKDKRQRDLSLAERSLEIKFKDKHLFNQALTHPSYVKKNHEDNARLEFLGDSFLGVVISHLLYEQNQRADEGELTKWKSHLVSTKFLAELSGRLGLGEYLLVGLGEKRSGHLTPSMLAATFEAVIGALYLDNGYQKAFKFIENLYLQHLKIPEKEEQNYKGLLQEMLQRKYREQPQYEVVREEGPDHAKIFEVRVLFRGKIFGSGKGGSKKDAEKEAAREAFAILGKDS